MGAKRTAKAQSTLPLEWPGGRRLLWVDGVNSAVMAHFILMDDPEAIPVHCDLGDSVHEDSRRFIDDLEQWFGKPIVRIRSDVYATIDEVFEHRKYLSGMEGAPCTGEMKFVPRLNFQLPSDTHFWGYTADKLDAARFDGMIADFPLLKQRSPLVEMGLKKRDTHAILRQHGIKRPWVYEIGMPNGNCLGCVKSSSPNYWALIRKHFPEVFERRNDQARRFGARPVILRRERGPDGKVHNIRGFLDEIPLDQSTKVRGANFGGCGFHCTGEEEVSPAVPDGRKVVALHKAGDGHLSPAAPLSASLPGPSAAHTPCLADGSGLSDHVAAHAATANN